jgi:hypothetical protein
MQLLFLFDWDMRDEETLMQALACQLYRLTGTYYNASVIEFNCGIFHNY